MQAYVLGADDPAILQEYLGEGPRYQVLPHLGYDENPTAAASFGDSYLVTKAYDREWHTAAYFFPSQRRAKFTYNRTHMRLLRDDPTAVKFYDNGGFEAWRVKPVQKGDEESGASAS